MQHLWLYMETSRVYINGGGGVYWGCLLVARGCLGVWSKPTLL